MKLDWENIKYIFQIPVRWFKDVQDKIYHAYGSGFIDVKQNGYNDGLQIGVDQAQFEAEVKRITGTSENQVSTVDGIGPNSDGNVALGSVRSINGEYFPDSDGNVNIALGDGRVKTVDNMQPFSDGNVWTYAIKKINDKYEIEYPWDGNVNIPFVESVDGVKPNANGNVVLGAYTPLDLADQGSVAGPSYTGDKPLSPMSHIHNVEELSGMKDRDGNLTFIKSINTSIKPDQNGNVNLNLPDTPAGTYLVASVDGIRPTDISGNVVLSAVRSIKMNGTVYGPDRNGQVTLSAAAGGISSVTVLGQKIQPENGDVDLGAIVYSVNGIEPDESGDVVLDIEDMPGIENYPTTTQVNTNINSHVEPISEVLNNTTSAVFDIQKQLSGCVTSLDVETKGTIVGLDYESERYVCNVNHGHKPSDIDGLSDEYVTLDTEQIITGQKTFTQPIFVSDVDGTNNDVQINPQGSIEVHGIGSNTGLAFYDANGNAKAGFRELITGTSLYSNGNLVISTYDDDTGTIVLGAPANQTGLTNSPTQDCPYENAVATVGFVRDFGLSGVVKLSGDQNIDGDKTFFQEITVGKFDSAKGHYGPNAVSLNGQSSTIQLGAGDTQASTIRKIQNQPLELRDSLQGVRISAPAGAAVLENQPTQTSPDNAIATVGYVNDNVGKVKKVNNISPDANGNVNVGTVKSVNGAVPDVNGNVVISVPSGSVKSVDGVSPGSDGDVSLGAVRVVDVETRGIRVNQNSTYAKYVCPTAHGHRAQDININGFATLYDWVSGPFAWGNNETYVDYLLNNVGMEKNLTVDGHATTVDANLNSVVNFGLAANKWLKSDGNGHITYTNDTPIALPSGTTGQSTTVTVLTGLSWNGSQLVATRSNLTYTNGCLTGVGAASNIAINTVAYS